jgi:methylated-DNA-protein-cysteine methyltransferase-like protein
MSSSYEAIYATTRRIPPGRVSSYGRVAELAGYPGRARLVGYALHALRGNSGADDVPWWRVINAAGRISNIYAPELQRALLESEGVRFNKQGYVDLELYLWAGDDPH